MIWLAVAMAMSECIGPIETRTGEVDIVALAPDAQPPLPAVEVEVEGTIHRGSLRLPYGQHRLVISARGFGQAVRIINLQQSRLTVRVELRLGKLIEDCQPEPAGAVGGQITGGDLRGLWVKAVPVVGIGGSESPVATTGFFLVDGLDATDHIVLVMRGKAVLQQLVVKAGTPQTQLKIELR